MSAPEKDTKMAFPSITNVSQDKTEVSPSLFTSNVVNDITNNNGLGST